MTISTALKRIKEHYNYAKTQSWINDPVAWSLYRTWIESEEKKYKKKESK